MSAPILPRRGFLSGLAALPLIGGSVALLGKPTGVATPPDRSELAAYAEWLECERRSVVRELYPDQGLYSHHPCNTGAHTYHFVPGAAPASSRAALVLATVGCDWRRDAL